MRLDRLVRASLVLALGFFGALAQAQQGLQFDPPPSPLGCLVSNRSPADRPAYPEAARAAGQTAVTRVRLRFDAADQAPAVDVTYNNGDAGFAQAVREFVSAYRLPCHVAGAGTVEATQEFQFVAPTVYWHPVRSRETAAPARPVSAECLASVRNAGVPKIPAEALRRGDIGNLLVELRFISADAAPEIVFLYDAGSRAFARSVREVVGKYRLPCLSADQFPLTARQEFSFRSDAPQTRLKADISIAELAALIRDLKTQNVRFDFATMGCPFELAFKPYRPYAANQVGEIAARDPNRRELIEWLAGVTLDIPAQALKDVLGQTTRVAFPCVVLDLL